MIMEVPMLSPESNPTGNKFNVLVIVLTVACIALAVYAFVLTSRLGRMEDSQQQSSAATKAQMAAMQTKLTALEQESSENKKIVADLVAQNTQKEIAAAKIELTEHDKKLDILHSTLNKIANVKNGKKK